MPHEQQLAIPTGHYAWICATDNGAVIPKDIADRISDPFFTTTKISEMLERSVGELVAMWTGSVVSRRSYDFTRDRMLVAATAISRDDADPQAGR
ncbi:hypothetical protein [Sphingobium xenophagum]|uniref:Uncharacterized protein n=1 Tax=Sphingobium xenophagum TaxID=121428 RepID=A0A401J6Z9_SPHXE|nr:hypothetical protein [Sphingobium xenophagum]GBH32364.1 hypothetical protein MBESOW_P3593 [Sphingobium xenophagum]